jgi:hypothetical protein
MALITDEHFKQLTFPFAQFVVTEVVVTQLLVIMSHSFPVPQLHTKLFTLVVPEGHSIQVDVAGFQIMFELQLHTTESAGRVFKGHALQVDFTRIFKDGHLHLSFCQVIPFRQLQAEELNFEFALTEALQVIHE